MNKPGPKTECDGKTERLTVTVDARTREFLLIAGHGNVSRGVRIAARLAYEKYQNEKMPAEAGDP